MKFDIVTIFPRMVEAGLAEGVVGRGIERGLLDVKVHDLRAYTTDRHRTVDDVPYGGGPGMVMKPEPLARAGALDGGATARTCSASCLRRCAPSCGLRIHSWRGLWTTSLAGEGRPVR